MHSRFLILFKDQISTSWRSKKAILFLVLYMSVFLLLALGIITIQTKIFEQFREQGIAQTQQDIALTFGRRALRSQNNDIIDFLIDVPFINIALFLVTIFGTPLLLLLLNYDKIAQEVYDGSFRYILFRTSRRSIYLSKFLGSIVECAIITFIALMTALLWAKWQISDLDLSKSFLYGLRFWTIGQVFLWVFIAFSLMFSTFFQKAFSALLVTASALFILFILPFWIGYISPYDLNYLSGLFFPTSPELFQSLITYLIFTLIFLSGGYFWFSRKDL